MKKFLFNKPIQDIEVGLDFLIVVLLMIFSGYWAWKSFITSPPYIDEKKYPVKGIDISSHNGNVDFKSVKKSGIDFVFIKATEGADFKDKNFSQNYSNARVEGLKIGVYHFFKFDKDGVLQANNLLNTLAFRKPELGIVVDVEREGNDTSIPLDSINERLATMVDYLNLKGHRVMFYTNKDGYHDYLAETFPGYPLWICSFSNNPFYGEWTFWQHNHHGKVNGIKGDVDLNVFCGSKKEWHNFLKGALWPYETQ